MAHFVGLHSDLHEFLARNVVGAYVALATPRDQRHVVVTGFQVQVSVLRLVGTSLYPVVDSMLIACGIERKLLRYRIHMSSLGATLAD